MCHAREQLTCAAAAGRQKFRRSGRGGPPLLKRSPPPSPTTPGFYQSSLQRTWLRIQARKTPLRGVCRCELARPEAAPTAPPFAPGRWAPRQTRRILPRLLALRDPQTIFGSSAHVHSPFVDGLWAAWEKNHLVQGD